MPITTNTSGGIGGLFEKAFHYFCLHRDEFLKHYHQRSNIESSFSAIKRKMGEMIRSKSETAATNEVLAKLVAYNLTCLVAEFHELGIVPEFTPACPLNDEPAFILRFPGA